MSWNNRVVWSEGLFIRPQHLQQLDRYIDALVDSRCRYLVPYGWGFQELSINEDLLTLGKFAMSTARGIFPDGTPFRIPEDDPSPVPLDVSETVRQQVVSLALPVRQVGNPEIDGYLATGGVTRYFRGEIEVKDTNANDQSAATIQVGKLRSRLLLEQDDSAGYACIGIARIAEVHPDKGIVLDREYVPPCTDCSVSSYLYGFVNELRGLLNHRAERLATRIAQPGAGGVAEVAEFLFLQVLNRLEPVVIHFGEMQGLHPERLFKLLLAAAGELATLTSEARRPPRFEAYRHGDLQATFAPVIAELRRALSTVPLERAIQIPLQDRKYNFRVAIVADRTLLSQATFVLAASAQLNPEVLRARFPTQVRIGPVERIQEFVKLALPGIPLRPLPVAPRQIPFHAGFSYFELDRTSQYWKQLDVSGGFGMHIAGEFPDLQLEFWAIRD